MKNCIKEIREARHVTQEELAKNINITKSYMCRFEAGTRNIPLSMAVAIADYLCVSLDELVGRERNTDHDA